MKASLNDMERGGKALPAPKRARTLEQLELNSAEQKIVGVDEVAAGLKTALLRALSWYINMRY